jgi:hypothetical protein
MARPLSNVARRRTASTPFFSFAQSLFAGFELNFCRLTRTYHGLVTNHAVLVQYERKLSALQIGFEQARSSNFLSTILLVLAIVVFLATTLLVLGRQISLAFPTVSASFATLAARRFHRNRRAQSKIRRLQSYYCRAVQRVKGDWAGTGVTGEEFSEPLHPYARDLNLFGEGSLFERICIACPRDPSAHIPSVHLRLDFDYRFSPQR